MRIVALGTLRGFWEANPDAEQSLKAWYDEAKAAEWKTPANIKARYGNASFVANNRVVFNIRGNSYRLIVSVAYQYQALYVKFIGTHAEYDEVDAATVEDT